MRTTIFLTAAMLVIARGATSMAAEPTNQPVPAALAFTMKSLDGRDVPLSRYMGKVVLCVNVASECGLTGQYEPMQALHKKYGADGLAVLGFPCNQFGAQEPGGAAEIAEFCKKNYGVEFDMFAKVEVNGPGACPLYKHLTAQATKPKGAGAIGWNFEKFLLDRSGAVIGRFEPDAAPDSPEIVAAIEKALKK